MKKFGKIMVIVLALATLVGACFAFAACNDNSVKIGAQQGTTGLFYLQGNADMNFSGYSNISAKSYDSIGQAVQDMINGNISYVVGDVEVAKSRRIPQLPQRRNLCDYSRVNSSRKLTNFP